MEWRELDLHHHHERGHGRTHKGHALDVGGVSGLEFEARIEVARRIPRMQLLSRWAVRMGLPGSRGGGLGLAYFGLADLDQVLTLLGVEWANVPRTTWPPEAG